MVQARQACWSSDTMEVPGWEKADMFENLTERLQRTFKNLRGQGKLSEEHLDAALADISEALLEGDVAVSVADELLANIRVKALGTEVMLQLSPDQQGVKIVRDEFTNLLTNH